MSLPLWMWYNPMFHQLSLVFLMYEQLMRQSKSYQNCRWLLPPCFHGSSFSSATHERLESQGSGKHTTRTDRTPQDILQCLDLNVMYVQLLILRNTCQHESYSITRTILGKEEDPILSRSIVVPQQYPFPKMTFDDLIKRADRSDLRNSWQKQKAAAFCN